MSAKGRAGITCEGQREIIRYLLDIGTAELSLVYKLHGVNSSHVKALEKKGITYNTLTLDDADSDRIIKESGLTSMPILEADDGKFYAGNDAYKYVETL
jgi:signal transduction histidine kinase